MFNFFDAVDVHRLFQFRATTDSNSFIPLLVFFLVLLLVAVVLRFAVLPRMSYKYQKKYVTAIITDLGVFALFGIAFVLSRRAGLALLGARIFVAAILFLLVWKALYFVFYRVAYFPAYESALNLEQKRMKYIPRKKRK